MGRGSKQHEKGVEVWGWDLGRDFLRGLAVEDVFLDGVEATTTPTTMGTRMRMRRRSENVEEWDRVEQENEWVKEESSRAEWVILYIKSTSEYIIEPYMGKIWIAYEIFNWGELLMLFQLKLNFHQSLSGWLIHNSGSKASICEWVRDRRLKGETETNFPIWNAA